jgi:hypothetical protein
MLLAMPSLFRRINVAALILLVACSGIWGTWSSAFAQDSTAAHTALQDQDGATDDPAGGSAKHCDHSCHAAGHLQAVAPLLHAGAPPTLRCPPGFGAAFHVSPSLPQHFPPPRARLLV